MEREAKQYYNQKEEKEILDALDEYVDLWNQRDISGIVDLFALDGKLISVIGVVARGRPAIEKMVTTLLNSLPLGTSMFQRVTETDFIRTDVAAVDSYWQLEFPKGKKVNHQEIPYREGLGIFIMSKEAEDKNDKKSWYIKSAYASGLLKAFGRQK